MQAGNLPHINSRNGHKPSPLNSYILPVEEKDEFDPKQLFSILRRRWWLLSVTAIAVTGAICGWTWTRPPIYQANFRMLVEPVSEDKNSNDWLRLGFGPSFDYATQIEVLRSPTLLEDIIEQLQQTYPNFSYGQLVGNLLIEQAEDSKGRLTKILSITYQGSDPQQIKLVLDTLRDGYLRYGVELRQFSLQRVVEFVDQQLPILEERVDLLQTELEQFRRRYSLIDPESRGLEISSLITEVNRQQKDTQTEIAQMQSLYVVLQRQLGSRPAEALAASALSESARYQQLLNQLLEVEAEIATESVRFQPDSPNIQVLLEKRENLLPLLSREAQRVLGSQLSSSVSGNLAPISVQLSKQLVQTTNQLQVLQVRLSALGQVENLLREEFLLIPALAHRYTDLQQKLQVANDSLARFLETRETLQIEAAQNSISWQVISEPYEPTSALSPSISRNFVLGAIAGLLLGIGAALIAEQLDNAFHSPSDLKNQTGMPLLGIVPFKRRLEQLTSATLVEDWSIPHNQNLGPVFGNNSQGEMLGNGTPIAGRVEYEFPSYRSKYSSSPFLEAFHSLYTNIRFLGSDTPIRSLAISSCLPAEGKSTISLYLARAAAAMGQRVLLVDTDLRNPQIHSRLNLPNMRGLSNLITTDLDLYEVIQRSPLEDRHLCVLTAGPIPPDPIKLLASRKMQSLADRFQNDFDLTIYDTPPSLGFADSSILASRADGMVLVVGMNKTSRSDISQVLDNLKMSYVSVLGTIANGVKGYTTGADYYYRYYAPSSQSRNSNGASRDELV